MSSSNSPTDRWARAMIWSIRNQDQISRCLRMSVWVGAVFVSFMGVIGLVPLKTALRILFYGGLVLSVGLWTLIQKRRTWLLRIKDPGLKQSAHDAMIAYLATKTHSDRHQKRSKPEPSKKERDCPSC